MARSTALFLRRRVQQVFSDKHLTKAVRCPLFSTLHLCHMLLLLSTLLLFTACEDERYTDDMLPTTPTIAVDTLPQSKDTAAILPSVPEELTPAAPQTVNTEINTQNTRPKDLIAYAKTLIGTPYAYGSTDPLQGFDCSGFITHVFNHFGIKVPRSSVDFTHVGETISLNKARTGDLILFTGTDTSTRVVGHMGIVTENSDTLRFIHSSSGKARGVVITPLNGYYKQRFVKVVRVF